MTHIGSKFGDYVHEIIVGRKGMPTEEIMIDGLANGIFLPVLLTHAAAGQGVLVTGWALPLPSPRLDPRSSWRPA